MIFTGNANGQANTSGTSGNGTTSADQQQVQVQQQAQQQTTIETAGTISVTVSQAQAQQLEQAAANGQQHVVTQHENADGTTSLSIAQVQTLDGHQLAIGNLNQVGVCGMEAVTRRCSFDRYCQDKSLNLCSSVLSFL